MKTLNLKILRGFSLITAIFLLVVLGTLGTLMVTFFAAQQQSSALDVMGSRAYHASRAGIEWAAFHVAQQPQDSGCVGIPTPLFAAGTLAGTLSPFAVSLSCSPASAVEGVTPIYVYDLTSTATYGGAPGNPDYVERVISVKMGR